MTSDISRDLSYLYVPVILISISQECGYFTAIGLRYISLMTLSDYITGAILCAPIVAVSYIQISVAFSYKIGVLRQDSAPLDAEKKVKTIKRDIKYFMLMFLFVAVGSLAIRTSYYIIATILMFISILMFNLSRIRMHRNNAYVDKRSYYIFYLGPPVFILSYALGLVHGEFDFNRTGYKAIVKDSNQTFNWIRSISAGSIVRVAPYGHVIFIPTESILSIESTYYACDSFGFWRDRKSIERIRDFFVDRRPCLPPQ